VTDSWRQPRRILMLGLGILTAIFLVVPTLVVIPMSVTASTTLTFPPEGFSTQWYQKMLTDPSWSNGLAHSFQVAILTALIATVLGTLAALGLVRGRFPGKGIVNAIMLSPLIVPLIVVAVGMFLLYVRWKITGSLVGLVAAHVGLAMPFVIVTTSASLRTIDRNLEMAAQTLGAGPFRTFLRVTLPLASPGVLAGALFAFMTSWDEVIVAIFLGTVRFRTLPAVIWEQVNESIDPTVAAVSTTVLAVTTGVLLLALLVRRRQSAQ